MLLHDLFTCHSTTLMPQLLSEALSVPELLNPYQHFLGVIVHGKTRPCKKPVAWWPGGGGQGARPPSDNFLGALKSKGGAKIRNCRCEISYKICKVQLVNKFKVVVILAFLQLFNQAIVFGNETIVTIFRGAED